MQHFHLLSEETITNTEIIVSCVIYFIISSYKVYTQERSRSFTVTSMGVESVTVNTFQLW